MKLHSLRLRNFRGLRAGIGLEEVFIDFDRLPEGLVAVVGPNGAGKTTLLDNAHPFRLMPFKLRKAKDWSPNAFSFYDQCYGSDALKEIVFSMGGAWYRSVVMIDADRRKQEAYLYRGDVSLSESSSSTFSWVPLNDGKTRTYDEAVEKVCGSPSLFFTSAFRAQGAKNLSDYTRGDILGIVAELLNIDHIREQGEKCRQVVAELASRSGRLAADIDVIAADLHEEEEVRGRQVALLDQVAAKQSSLAGARKELERLGRDIAETEQRQATRKSDEERLKKVQSDADAVRQERQSVLAGIEEKKAAAQKKREQAEAEYRRAKDDHAREVAGIEQERSDAESRTTSRLAAVTQKLEKARKIVANAEGIRSKVREEETAAEDLQQTRASIADEDLRRSQLAAKNEELRGLLREETDLRLQLKTFGHEQERRIQTARQALDSARREATKLEGIDCKADGSGWVNGACRFVTDAVAAKERLPEIEKALAQAQEPSREAIDCEGRVRAAREKAAAIEGIPGELQACEDGIATLRQKATEIETSLADIARWTRLVPELDRAESDIAEFEADIAAAQQEQAEAKARFDARRQAADERLESARQKVQQAKTDIDHDLERDTADLKRRSQELFDRFDALESDVSRLKSLLAEDLEQALSDLRQKQAHQRSLMESAEAALPSLHAEIGRCKGRLEEFAAQRRRMGDLETLRERIDAEAVNWKILVKAFSNDGITALELDDASPSISAIVNDLLRVCYGPRFSVRMETQTAKTNGDMKEDFDILVMDSETDEAKSITEMSGGQITWINDAITRGINLFNINRSDRIFETIYSDEKDGALSLDKKIEFMEVKRRSMDIGTHRREFFISQTPELVDMADGKIVLSPGKVEVV